MTSLDYRFCYKLKTKESRRKPCLGSGKHGMLIHCRSVDASFPEQDNARNVRNQEKHIKSSIQDMLSSDDHGKYLFPVAAMLAHYVRSIQDLRQQSKE